MASRASSIVKIDTRKLMQSVEKEVKGNMKDAAEEIVKKAKQKVPVDTGALKRSIDYDLERSRNGFKVRVYADEPYAIFVEMGTRFMDAQPYLRPALFNNRNTIFRKVVGR